MTSLRCWLALSVVVAIQAASSTQAQHAPRGTTRDSDEANESRFNDGRINDGRINDGRITNGGIAEAQIRERKNSDDNTDLNSRTGRHLSRFGQSPYDSQLGFSRFGNTNLFGTSQPFGSSSFLGSGTLNGLNTPGYPDPLSNYNTLNPFGGAQFGSYLNPYQGSYPFNSLGQNQYSNAQLLGDRLGSNYLQSGLLSSQLGNGQFSSNNQLSNYLLSKSQLFNSLRNQYATSQGFGNQFLTPESLASTIAYDSHNDGYGKYSYQFETDNGIAQEQTRQLVGPDSYAVTGSYSYTSPEGELVTVKYVADENGFQVDSPNLPPIPEHAKLQLLAAQQAKKLGLIDSYGNPTGLKTNYDKYGYSSGNSLGATGLGLNSNIGLGSSSGLLNSGYGTSGLQNYNSLDNGYRSGNLVKTSIIKRPILGDLNTRTAEIYNRNLLDNRNPNSQSIILSRIGTSYPDSDEYDGSYERNRYRGNELPLSLTRQNLGATAFANRYPQLSASSRSLRLPEEYSDGRYSLFSADSDFNRQYSNANSFGNLNAGISTFGNPYSVEELPRFERLRSNNGRALGSPFFQPLTASRLAIQDGRPRRLIFRRHNFRGKPADIALASKRDSPISNNVASYIYRS